MGHTFRTKKEMIVFLPLGLFSTTNSSTSVGLAQVMHNQKMGGLLVSSAMKADAPCSFGRSGTIDLPCEPSLACTALLLLSLPVRIPDTNSPTPSASSSSWVDADFALLRTGGRAAEGSQLVALPKTILLPSFRFPVLVLRFAAWQFLWLLLSRQLADFPQTLPSSRALESRHGYLERARTRCKCWKCWHRQPARRSASGLFVFTCWTCMVALDNWTPLFCKLRG